MKLFKRRPKPENSARSVSADSDAATDTDTDAAAAEPSAGADAAAVPASGSTAESQPAEASAGVFGRLRKGLSRSRDQFTEGLASLVLGKKQLDPALLEALEEQLKSSTQDDAEFGVDPFGEDGSSAMCFI